MQEVKIVSAPFPPFLVRIPSLRIKTSGRVEVFVANLKTETELWNLMVKEMWAGREMADQHKVQQRLKSSNLKVAGLAVFAFSIKKKNVISKVWL